MLEEVEETENPAAPLATIDFTVEPTNRCREIAENPHATPRVLEILAGDSGIEVRRAVASNPNTLAAVLEKLSDDSDIGVRICVAINLRRRTPNDRVKLERDAICTGNAGGK